YGIFRCPSTVSTDLADPAPASSLRRTGPSGHQTIEATPHLEDDSPTPKTRLSDRATESSTQPSTSAVIFEPGVPPASFCEVGSWGLPPYDPTTYLNRQANTAPLPHAKRPPHKRLRPCRQSGN